MKKTLFAILSLALLASCSGKEPALHGDEAQTVDEIVVTTGGYTVGTQTRADGDGDAGSTTVDILTSNEFAEGSVLYISQMGTTLDPDFSAEPGAGNLYVYNYSRNDDADWDKEFNFKPGNNYPIEWDAVRGRGPVGNSFSLYALHFPVDNAVKVDNAKFAVQTDQRGPAGNRYDLSNFLKSDILGAYHATSALHTRMRFRLHHLMVYLRVTLYVPVYKQDTNGQGYSGFDEDAVLYAVAEDVCSDFKIEWRTNRSSDTDAPLTDTNTSSRKRIYMYAHPSDPAIIEDFEVKDHYDKEESDKDDVRVYDFSVLIPDQGQIDKNKNLLRFQLRSPGDKGGDRVKNYYFAPIQLAENHTDFGLTQGTLQHLSLYLPRSGNNTIVVGANILPWTDARTEMTVTDQGGEDNGTGGNTGEDGDDGDDGEGTGD